MSKTSFSAPWVTSKPTPNLDDVEFNDWIARMNARFTALVRQGDIPLFKADLPDLFAIYLAALPPADRQYHNCHECSRFINSYGNLLVVGDNGKLHSAIWNETDAPAYYKPVVEAMIDALVEAGIKEVFYTTDRKWGTHLAGGWTHFAISPPTAILHGEKVRSAYQKTAEKTEDFKNMKRALAEFGRPAVEAAVQLLKSEALYRSEKVLGPAQWLLDVMDNRDGVRANWAKDNMLWLAVATAPAGFAHPRSSMIGTLLEDLQAGKRIEDAKRSFAAKMHPLQYQRPTAPPAAGTIDQAEKLVKQLGLEKSLKRRMAKPEDVVETLWEPTEVKAAKKAKKDGVFGHLKPKGTPAEGVVLPAISMSWAKFARTMLDDALEIELLLPVSGNFSPLVTAVDEDAPPILQWDRPEQRNPVNWYVWNGGSQPSQFGLVRGTYAKIWAVTRKPSHWFGFKASNQQDGVLLMIEGAKETRFHGLALFPETIKSELHSVRSVIEAHSRSGELGNQHGRHAVGMTVPASPGDQDHTLRVTTKLGRQLVKIDRWE